MKKPPHRHLSANSQRHRDRRLARLDPIVAKMYAWYQIGHTLAQVAQKFGRPGKHGQQSVFHLFKVRGLKCRKGPGPEAYRKIGTTHRAKLDGLVAKMYADYQSPMSLAAVGRKYHRDRRAISELFARRGLPVRPVAYTVRRLPNGQIEPAKPITEEKLAALIEQATAIKVPAELKHEWRKWPLAKRGEFIARMRKKLALSNERPTTPFSSNVKPFDYASPEAHAIEQRMNAGRDSRSKAVQIHIGSQGVIYEGRLYFWSKSSGPAYFIGPWRPGIGRPPLHHVIWEQHHGPVPAGHTVRHADGNRNNLDPTNLFLATRDDVCRENQFKALTKKSLEFTQLLLTRQQAPHANTNTLRHLRLRHTQRRPAGAHAL